MDDIVFYTVEKDGKKIEMSRIDYEDAYEFCLGAWFASYPKKKFSMWEALQDVKKLFGIKILQECK